MQLMFGKMQKEVEERDLRGARLITIFKSVILYRRKRQFIRAWMHLMSDLH